MEKDERFDRSTFRAGSLPRAQSQCVASGGNMLKRVVLAFALAAAGFASQSASGSPLTSPAVIADARGVSLQHIQYYDPPPRYERRYAGPPRRYYDRPYWRRGDGPPPWARPWWRRDHERPYRERGEYYGRRW